jgi:Thaumatin family
MDEMILTRAWVKKSLVSAVLFSVFQLKALATNPIEARLIENFPASVATNGSTYTASYSFTSKIPFTMVTPFTILKDNNAPTDFTYNDQCSGKLLAYQESCIVTIYLRPTTAGSKTITLIEAYGNDRVPVTSLSTTASGNGGGGSSSTYVTGTVITALPATSVVNTAQPWKFQFKNTGSQSATLTGYTVEGSDAGYTSDCGSSLGTTSPSNVCYFKGTYTPQTSSPHSISAILNYQQGTPVEVVTSTNTSTKGQILSCTTQVGFAPQTLTGATVNNITLLCTNNSSETVFIDTHTSSYPSSASSGTFTVYNPSSSSPPAGDNCTGTLPASASCQLKGNYTAPGSAISPVTVSLTVNYHTQSQSSLVSSASTSTAVVTSITNTRTLNIVNQCPFDVYWGMVSGAATHLGSCTTDANCAGGAASCDTNNNTCYYKTNWSPTGGTGGNPYHLTPLGGGGNTASVTISQNAASGGSGNILWSGLISGSTNCHGATCENNPCGNVGGTTSCPPGSGFDQPATEAEFTLLLQGQGLQDSYDISNVNGVSIPMSMVASPAGSDFNCGNAGNPNASGSLGGCAYNNVTPPSYIYNWVTNTGTACTAQNTCTNPNYLCGYYKNGSSFIKNCGAFRGYWSANEICQTNPSFSGDLGNGVTCSQVLTGAFPPPNGTITDLLKCSPPDASAFLYNSCYLNLSGNPGQCCGCTNWSNTGATAQCTRSATDSQWTNYILNLVKWQKQACATSYSYPYDDPSSSFKCTAGPTTSYTITFCPGGVTALPSGIPASADGRNA